MQFRELGRPDVLVSPLVLGTDNFGNPTSEQEASRIVDRAIDAGINLIDTANVYSDGESERIIGRALKRNGRRDQVLLATKFHYRFGPGSADAGNSRAAIIRAVEGSLRRLDVDCIDLYQAHRPDFAIPIEETLSALTDLIRQGKVRFIGSTTAPGWHIAEAQLTSELRQLERYISEQTPYNLLDRRAENEIFPACRQFSLGVICWSPLAMGMLAGRYADGVVFEPDSRARLRGGIYAERVSHQAVEYGNRFCGLAADAGFDPARLAVLWVQAQPHVTAPIIGPRTVEQLEHLLPVLEMELSEEIRRACDSLIPAGSAVANFFNSSGWMKQRLDLAGDS